MRGVIPYYEGLHPKEAYELPVYHYTSPEGFMSIIEHQTLWFSRFDCLNDYRDGEVAKELYPICLDELFQSGELDRKYYEQYKMIDYEHNVFVSMHYPYKKISCKPYVCCFSMNYDSLQMWQYYTKASNFEGYNIGFDLQKIREKYLRVIKTGKVFYEKESQKKAIKNMISDIYKCDLENTKDFGRQFYSVDQLSAEVEQLGCFFKNTCYEGENEVRAVIEIPDDRNFREQYWNEKCDGSKDCPEIKYRIAHGMMIPYFALHIEKDWVKCITIGPITSNKDESAEKNKEIVDTFLFERLGRKINVNVSKIPVRY